jgi:tetratricopeptide (TPR) repeat protein
MASPEQGGRKPVTVIHFPKVVPKPAATAPRRRTQSITELKPFDDDITDPTGATANDAGRRRVSGRRTKTLESSPLPEAHVGHVVKRARTPQEAADLAAFGHELFELGRFEEARVIFEGLVNHDVRDGFAHTMLGTIYLALNAHDRALALFQASLKIDADDLAALVYRGEIRLNRGKVKSAIEDLARAVTLAPASDPFVERAKRLLKMGKALVKKAKR